ncbi:MAG: sigma-70 family RNA polymerase sigma factor [Clostridia bacterium]|nr:sigma-70 family RNA polymerase sigma factor [Clostridia bacterium]
MDDARIVDLYLTRDEAAIAATADKYGAHLRALALTITADAPAAEECENDTYLAAWRSIPPHEPRDYFWAFLARLTRHAALDSVRARRTAKRAGEIVELGDELAACLPAPESIEQTLDNAALADAISAFLRGLSPAERTLFVRRYWNLEPIAALAKRYGMRESRVKSTLHRLRGRLRTHLEKEGFTI